MLNYQRVSQIHLKATSPIWPSLTIPDFHRFPSFSSRFKRQGYEFDSGPSPVAWAFWLFGLIHVYDVIYVLYIYTVYIIISYTYYKLYIYYIVYNIVWRCLVSKLRLGPCHHQAATILPHGIPSSQAYCPVAPHPSQPIRWDICWMLWGRTLVSELGLVAACRLEMCGPWAWMMGTCSANHYQKKHMVNKIQVNKNMV